MKIFWPHRSKAKGFSIQNLAFKYREKMTRVSPNEVSCEFSVGRNLNPIPEDKNEIGISHLLIRKGHWANRDFSEYRNTA